MSKQSKYCSFGKIKIKEDEKDYYVTGYVATSHPDRAETDDYAGDIIPKSTLSKIVDNINNKYKPEAGAVSERHDWLKQGNPDLPLAGVTTSPAKLVELEDGEFAVEVETVLAKSNPRYEEVKNNIEQGVYPGFSIEYTTNNFIPTVKEGKDYRILTDIDVEGFGFANRRMIANPHAEITSAGYKEIMSIKKSKGDIKMKKEVIEKKEDAPEEKKEEPKVEEKVEEKTEEKVEEKTEEKAEEKETKEYKVSSEDMAILAKFKEQKEREVKMKEIEPIVAARVKEELKEVRTRSSPFINTQDNKPEFKEFDSYQKALAESKELDNSMPSSERHSKWKMSISKQYKEGARLTNALMAKGVNVYKNWKEKDPVGIPEEGSSHPYEFNTYGMRIEAKEFSRVEMKGLDTASNAGGQTDTNLASTSWTYGSYFLSPVELNDIFQPMLVNQLNDQTTTYGRLQKEDWSGRSQIQFRARTGRNSTVGGYSEGTNLVYGTDFSGQVGRDKFQQPFSYYRVLVAVTGQAQRFAMAPGGMGDRWADEIKWSGADLLAASGGLNLAVLGTGDGTSESTSLGFEGLILGTSGTLYGKSLATYPTLKSHKENMSSARVTLDQLRKMIRFAQIGDSGNSIDSNARIGDLVFFANHLQVDFVKGLIQDMQRLVPTSARVGFEGTVEFDGVPFVADSDINTDDIFLIDTAHTKIAVNLPPTLEPLPVTADAQAAHIKTYWNLYSDIPSNNYFANTFATS